MIKCQEISSSSDAIFVYITFYLLLLIFTRGYFYHWFLERVEGVGETERDKHWCERDTSTGSLLQVP